MIRVIAYAGLALLVFQTWLLGADRPNILWIVTEDASPHLSCYGETTIRTPHLDRLAEEGIRFTNAFVTCPVCSPCRSAMVSGMYQTTLGAHHHRSQISAGKNSAKVDKYASSYALPSNITLVPELFRKAGYYVVNGGTGKTDYNFTTPDDLYDSKKLSDALKNKPFFAQVQLRGGKNRKAKVSRPVNPENVTLPPYYPDHTVLREDWARYLNSWISTDNEVGQIVADLKSAGLLDKTAIFFWTDHGISHARGKQFLYEEGIHVPLIVRLPQKQLAGTLRDDLVIHIDVAAASLRLAGIDIPEYIQGQPILDEDYRARRRIFSARDRCDETAEIIRCVRTPQFKYIRNFMPHLSHMQPNRYKDGKDIVAMMRELNSQGKLNALQSRIFQPTREPEELYDLSEDPNETNNLLTGTGDEQRAYRDTANVLRLALYQWMIDSGDLGLIPEPVLEELGKQKGSKYAVGGPKQNSRLTWKLIETIEAKERSDVDALLTALSDDSPSVRWWAATGLGLCKSTAQEEEIVEALATSLSDKFAGVRIAAAQALARHGDVQSATKILEDELGSSNRVASMYSMRAIEFLGDDARPLLPAIKTAQQYPYDFTRRIADRVVRNLSP